MPRRIALPRMLIGAAFLTTDPMASTVSAKRLRGRDVERPYRGVRSVGLDASSVYGRCRAYEPRMPPAHFFSHITAAQLYGIPLPVDLENDTTLHVSVRDGSSRPRVRGVVGHRLSPDTGIHLREGFVVSDPVSTWCHLASVLGVDDLIAVGDYLVSGRVTDNGREAPLATIDDLRAGTRAWSGKRGAQGLAAAIDFVRTGVDSRPESRLRMLLIRGGLPEPIINEVTFDDRGMRLGKPDLKYRAERVVFEYEGDGHRTDKRRFRRDIFRRELFEDAGWRVIRVTADDVFIAPGAFLVRVRKTLARRRREIS